MGWGGASRGRWWRGRVLGSGTDVGGVGVETGDGGWGIVEFGSGCA